MEPDLIQDAPYNLVQQLWDGAWQLVERGNGGDDGHTEAGQTQQVLQMDRT